MEASLTPAVEGGFVVSFPDIPDIPEVLTQENTRHDALQAAQTALITAFEFYFDDNEAIPLPSAVGAEDTYVEIPLSVASKVLLLNAFLESKITQQELANRIGRPKQEITRLFDLKHTTKIDAVQIAARVLGKELALTML
ncbi:type II toxin-antitoxin system HicB family antitoxin [Citrobacter freundii]|nr:type II toxin-antitoxin system HicB family antitoxin [Citrobacter freundii]